MSRGNSQTVMLSIRSAAAPAQKELHVLSKTCAGTPERILVTGTSRDHAGPARCMHRTGLSLVAAAGAFTSSMLVFHLVLVHCSCH